MIMHLFLKVTNHSVYFLRRTEIAEAYFILQCGKLFKNVTQLVSLPGSVVAVDLYQTAEWL